ncbi:MAG TPA: caspase family protein, partial [Paracoccaceae bacterium]|nr:caspase family protein [Paracoccaceae bacterium]
LLTTRYGFTTTATTPEGQALDLFLPNATRLQIETALYQISRIAGAKDTVLIFYAGHGIYEQATQGAFWLPVDAQAGLPFSWLPAAAISDAILRIEAGNVLVISDSCYSGALLRGDGASEPVDDTDRLRALQRLADKRSRIVIASGGNEPVLDGGGDGHSVFARALLTGLEQMEDDAFTARELFDRYLLPMVVGQAAQEPQYRPIERSGHEGGDVVLARIRPGGG